MKVDRNTRLMVIGPMGHALDVAVGELMDQIKAQILADLEVAVLADLRALLGGASNQARPIVKTIA
jgi:hypothetical protein